MLQNQDFLMGIRSVIKLYECMLKKVCETYGLNAVEANIVDFLHNNPDKNLAADIAEYRMRSKANVSKGVEGLIRKGFLQRQEDLRDRRRINLRLLPAAEPIVREFERVRDMFFASIFSGFTEQEKKEYYRFDEEIIKNTKRALADLSDRQSGEGGNE